MFRVCLILEKPELAVRAYPFWHVPKRHISSMENKSCGLVNNTTVAGDIARDLRTKAVDLD